MEKLQKKQVKKYISWALILALVLFLAFMPVIAAKEEMASGPQASILSAEAQKRDLSTQVLGGGTLAGDTAVQITIPGEVKVTEYLVKNGDLVTEGQPIATVDRVSVMTAITQIQQTMEDLREQLEDVSGDTADHQVIASAGGTVKVIYGTKGESVQDVMLRDGALAVLSLDGQMAVQIQRDTNFTGGDTLCVTLSDGREVSGTVESNLEGVLTVLVEDEDFPLGEKVKVTTEDGDRIGSGQLYVHSPWNVVAYSGTISRVRVSQGDTVNTGRTLFDLEDTGYTAEFFALSRQHREYEEIMRDLFVMYQSEAITAPAAGMVTGVDENGSYMLSGQDSGWTITLLANAPGADPEASYQNFVGQVAEVAIDGLIMKMNPQAYSVSDYMNLSVPMDTALMTMDAVYVDGGAPVYELQGGQWTSIGYGALTAGDILLFAGDSSYNFVWLVRIGHIPVTPTNPDPSQPTEPTDPTEPGTPTDPSVPPSGPPAQGGMPTMSGFGGAMPQQEAEDDLYSMETVTIASVTAQEFAILPITVDEWDISGLRIGQSVTVTVEALSGQQFAGTITDISSSGEKEEGNSKFTVEVTVEKTEEMLPGMRAYAAITLSTQEDVLCIPAAALMETGTDTQVYTGYDEKTQIFTGAVSVVTGISDGEYVQILSGLEAGQIVWYPYYDTLEVSNAPDMGGGFPFG